MSKRLKTLVKDRVDVVDDDVTKKSGQDIYSEMVRCSRQIVFKMRNYFNDNVACEDLMALFQNGVKVLVCLLVYKEKSTLSSLLLQINYNVQNFSFPQSIGKSSEDLFDVLKLGLDV